MTIGQSFKFLFVTTWTLFLPTIAFVIESSCSTYNFLDGKWKAVIEPSMYLTNPFPTYWRKDTVAPNSSISADKGVFHVFNRGFLCTARQFAPGEAPFKMTGKFRFVETQQWYGGFDFLLWVSRANGIREQPDWFEMQNSLAIALIQNDVSTISFLNYGSFLLVQSVWTVKKFLQWKLTLTKPIGCSLNSKMMGFRMAVHSATVQEEHTAHEERVAWWLRRIMWGCTTERWPVVDVYITWNLQIYACLLGQTERNGKQYIHNVVRLVMRQYMSIH